MSGFWKRLLGESPDRRVASPAVSVTVNRSTHSQRADTPAPRRASGDRDVVGDGYMAVHGESFKRANLDHLMRHRKRADITFSVAVMRPEPHPKHANAIAVLIDDLPVGYLPRSVADEMIDAFGGAPLLCAAQVRRSDPNHDWNVVLRVDYDELRGRASRIRSERRTATLKPKLDAVRAAADAMARADEPANGLRAAALRATRDRAIVDARSDPNLRPTLAEIAAVAGISVNTASRIARATQTANR